jgi:hypothetical protein
VRQKAVIGISPEVLVEASDTLFTRALHNSTPATLQGTFEKPGQHVIEALALEMVKPDFGHVRDNLTILS